MRGLHTLREIFLHILDTYESSKYENLEGHPTGRIIRQQLKHQLMLDADLPTETYAVTGSVGQGQWAEIPWVAIFLKQITIRATKGYDIVYLFPADMSGVYISLNQGWTYFREKYGGKEGSNKIITVANVVRDRLHLVPELLQLSSIDLKGRGDLSKEYEKGHIIGRFYPKEAFPSSHELIQDVRDLLTVYREVESLMEGRSVDQFNDYLLMYEDGYYVEEKEEDQYQETIAQHLEKYGLTVQEELVPYPLPRPKPIIFQQTQQWPRNAAIANVGSDNGISEGQQILIYSLGEHIEDPDTGESYGRLEIVKGTGTVTNAQERISTVLSDKRSKPEKRIVKYKGGSFFGPVGGREADEEVFDGETEILPFENPRIDDLVKLI